MLAASVLVGGCAHTRFPDRAEDWGAVWDTMYEVELPFGSDLEQRGYGACTRMLTAATRLAVGDQPLSFFSGGGAAEDVNSRPVSYTMPAGRGADTWHVTVTAGLDHGGKCFARWQATRVWNASCEVIAKEASWVTDYPEVHEANRHTKLYKRPDGGLELWLTKTGRKQCLVSVGEISYHAGATADMSSDEPDSTTSQ